MGDFLDFAADMFDLWLMSAKRKAFWHVLGAFLTIIALSWPADAAVRYSERIEAVPGLRFENFLYAWDKVELDVVNTTSSNRSFEGTMVFLDRRGRSLARASLLPKRIPGGRAERYAAWFVEGSGESAQGAVRIIWDFGAR